MNLSPWHCWEQISLEIFKVQTKTRGNGNLKPKGGGSFPALQIVGEKAMQE